MRVQSNVRRSVHVAAALLAGVLLVACASGRTTITLPRSETAGAAQTSLSGARLATVKLVTDARVYEDAPSEPSTPSLGEEPASKASADVKARAVARKRNGYGLAQGDVILSSTETVRSVVQSNVEAALTNAGYRVVPSIGDNGSQPIGIEVTINEFWLWLQPGVMVGTIRSRISTDIKIGTTSISVVAETSQPGQIFSEESWAKAVGVAVDEFRKQATLKFAANR